MRKFIAIIVVWLWVCSCGAQTYSALWKQVESAAKADLPRDEIALLRQIETKARKDKEYGQLLKASMQVIAVEGDISADSLVVEVERCKIESAKATDEVLSAVYNAALGHIYKTCFSSLGISDKEASQQSKLYYSQALAKPSLLAKAKARGYEPFVVSGANSSIFNNDVLHLIAFEAEDYDAMIDYYSGVGNRSAVCLASLYKLRTERREGEEPKKSKYLAQVDELIHEYYDLEVAGELAIEHFNVIDASADVSAEEKLTFIDDALLLWGTWPRMVVLRNARSRITLPAYTVDIPNTLTIPNREIPVYITSLKNIQSIRMNVYSLDIGGDEEYNINNSDDYKALLSKRSDKAVATDSRTYYGIDEYREIRDTLTIDPLPVGVYLVEFTTDNSGVATERALLHITNLRVIDMNLPENKMRLIAVDATSGEPIAKANIYVMFRSWQDKRWQEEETLLTTESDGEVIYSSTLSPYKYRVTTAEDKAFPWQTISRRTWATATDEEKTTEVLKLFSDRAIYRPAQKIEATLLAYTTFSEERWEVSAKKKVHLLLRDAKNTTIAEEDVTTDEWGVAAVSFALPDEALTGYYSLRATSDNASTSLSLRVEEYKRPTFTIEIDDYKSQYKEGDTITVKAWARTFSDMPVAQAKVSFSAQTQLNHWWRGVAASDAEKVVEDTTTTASDGSFLMRIPMTFPSKTKKSNRMARVTLSAQVTDLAGETHSATSSYPLSDKPTMFDLSDFNDKQCREEITPFSFVYLNSAGVELADTVNYSIDGEGLSSVPTNTALHLPTTLSSGAHTLKAVCQSDTINQPFIVFSLDDKAAPVDTAAWYYSTSGQAPHYTLAPDETVYIQVGSSRPAQTIFYTIASDTAMLESGQLQLSNSLMKRSFKYDAAWGNGLAIRYSWVRDGELYTYSESLSRPVKDCSLSVEFSTFRDRLSPGEKETWTIKVKEPDGSPAKAQLMAVLFDKSLDAIYRHDWTLTHKPYYLSPTIYQTATYNKGEQLLYGEQSIRYAAEPALQFYHFDFPSFIYNVPTPLLLSPNNRMLSARSTTYSTDDTPEVESLTPIDSDIAIRENLAETAFFFPQLTTDKNGDISIHFTLPEDLTTWRFMSIAHDKAMNVGALQSEVIVQKDLMVTPNVPRFIRQGDKAQLSARIANSSDEAITAVATISIAAPESEELLFKYSKTCEVEGRSTAAVVFDLPSDLAADVYVCDITAQAGAVSDGERHYLPVLSNDIEVYTTRAFTQTHPGEKVIDLTPLYGANSKDEHLNVDYTDNAALLLLDALPVIASPDADNAISLSTALYATAIIESLRQQFAQDSLIGHTPYSTDELSLKLRQLQRDDGAFAWFNGMQPSVYVTLSVATTLVRMKHLHFDIDENVCAQAISFLDKQLAAYVERLKKVEGEGNAAPTIDHSAIEYLYVQALYGEALGIGKDNADYLLSHISERSDDLTIGDKATLATIFALHPLAEDRERALELLESIRQYSVATEEKGRYFDTPKAAYSWRDYKLPTQTAAIEAFSTITPKDTATIVSLQQWLLQEKRTQQWDTPLNSASAIYAFFNGWSSDKGALSASASRLKEAKEKTRLYVDNKEIDAPATLLGRYKELKAEKTSSDISWGAVSVVCTQKLEDVTSDGEELSIRREIVDVNGEKVEGALTVGQRVKVRITVVAQRDYDFIEITDNRAACLEVVNPLSGYSNGCFSTPLDNKTVYYFDKFAKGQKIIETEYYIERQGDYTSGVATVRCAYAPEYQGREGCFTINVR